MPKKSGETQIDLGVKRRQGETSIQRRMIKTHGDLESLHLSASY